VADIQFKDAIAYVGTFPPRQCGIGTYTADLVRACRANMDGRLRAIVVAIDNPNDHISYGPAVKGVVGQHDRQRYVQAAEFLNFNKVRAVSVQHEFGIFGGPDGAYILDMVRELRCPVVTTFHTLLQSPSDGQREIMEELVVLSSRLVAMSARGVEFLRTVYDAPEDKIRLIPHGIPQIPFVEPDAYKEQFDMAGRKVIFTFGLLNPGKGIEYVLEALPAVVADYPEVSYIVLGATHPEVLKQSGQSYRLSLVRKAQELGLQKNVLFRNQFVELEELCEFLKASDFYVTPYLNRDQVVSGTLAYALGAGKPIISTPYWHAEELLADRRGVLVDFRAPDQISEALLDLLGSPRKVREMRANAYEYSRRMLWPQVGKEFLNVCREAISAARVTVSTPDESMRHILPITGLPRVRLAHLSQMTDDTGLLQHACYSVPNRLHGYCTDDNARALVVAAKHHKLFRDEESERLLTVYLSFVQFAQREEGLFHNFMSYDRRFRDEVGSDDCFGRALWGLGYVICHGPPQHVPVAKEVFERALPNLKALNLRGRSHGVMGLYYYLQKYPEAEDIAERIDALCRAHTEQFETESSEAWPWFESVLTYDCAVIPQSLLLGYEVTGRQGYAAVGLQSLDFLIELCDRGRHFSLVGNDGWHEQGETKAEFDQQPLDACGLVEACKVAFRLSGERKYLKYMRQAFDWFLGVNVLGEVLYDFKTGACCDGLTPDGVNQNKGAESTLCCLLPLLTLTETFSEQDRSARRSATR